MSTYVGRVALVTGASSGIGAGIAERLVKSGLIVVGVARRAHLIQALSDRLQGEKGRLIARKVDLSKEKEILEMFKWIEGELGGADVLINNAAVALQKAIHTQTVEQLKYTNDLNYIAVVIASREFVNGLMQRGVTDGVIINMNSYVGHYLPLFPGISLGTYPSTKSAMRSICTLFRHDMKNANLPIRITNLSPGAVRTEMLQDLKTHNIAKTSLEVDDVADTIHFILSLPKTVEITELMIRPTGEAF